MRNSVSNMHLLKLFPSQLKIRIQAAHNNKFYDQTGTSVISTLETVLSQLTFQALAGMTLNSTSLDVIKKSHHTPSVRVITLSELSGGKEQKVSRVWIIADAKQPLELFFINNKSDVSSIIENEQPIFFPFSKN